MQDLIASDIQADSEKNSKIILNRGGAIRPLLGILDPVPYHREIEVQHTRQFDRQSGSGMVGVGPRALMSNSGGTGQDLP